MLEKYKILRNAEKFVIGRKVDLAIREYHKLLQKEGEDPAVLNTMGDLLLKSGRREEALEQFKRVSEIYLNSGFVAKAIAIAKKIHNLNPSDEAISETLVELYNKQGLGFEAIRHMESLIDRFVGWGQMEKALSWQERLIAMDPERPESLLKSAGIQSQGGEIDLAVTHYRSAARLFLDQDLPEKGFDSARQALRLNREDPETSQLLNRAVQQLKELYERHERLEELGRIESELEELGCVEMLHSDWSSQHQDQTSQEYLESPPHVDGDFQLQDEVTFVGNSVEGDDLSDETFDLNELISPDPEPEQDETQEPLPPVDDKLLQPSDDEARENNVIEGNFLKINSGELETEPTPESQQSEAPEEYNDTEEPGIEADTAWDGCLEEALQEVDFYLKLGLKDDARKLLTVLVKEFPRDERVIHRAEKVMIPLPELADEPSADVAEDSDLFDSELETALDDLFQPGIFSEPDEVLRYDVTSSNGSGEKEDAKVHYDLGMAYKEMGLLEDAVEKFTEAYQLFQDENSPQKILCCSMLANAYLQMESFEDALKWAQEGLQLPEKKEFEWKALLFDRSHAYQELGETQQALDGYQEILERDPDYRDLGSRIESLTVRVNGQ